MIILEPQDCAVPGCRFDYPLPYNNGLDGALAGPDMAPAVNRAMYLSRPVAGTTMPFGMSNPYSYDAPFSMVEMLSVHPIYYNQKKGRIKAPE